MLGPRRHAAAQVRQRDVDLKRGTMRFQEKGGKIVVKPMPDELVAILSAAWEYLQTAASVNGVWEGLGTACPSRSRRS